MAKINHLEMTENLMALNDIEVKKGFMGWTMKLIYKPTNSVLKVKGMVVNSRIWLHRLMQRISEAKERDEAIWLTIV